MISKAADYLFLALAAAPFIYYLLVLYCSWRFFRSSKDRLPGNSDFVPPISSLKPIRGLDPEAYENYASFCQQDYPDYELIFCVGDRNDPAAPLLEKLIRDFPERRIRLLFGSGRGAINDKVAKLVRMVQEADNEFLVISDSDVRVQPDYLRTVVAPLCDPKVGCVTCFYVSIHDETFAERPESKDRSHDICRGIAVAVRMFDLRCTLRPTLLEILL